MVESGRLVSGNHVCCQDSFEQTVQTMTHSLFADRSPFSGKKAGLRLATSIAQCPGKTDHPHGLLWRSAVRSGNPGDRHRPVAAAMRQRALRHRPRRCLRHGAVPGQRIRWHAQHLLLGSIRISHESTIKPPGTACHRSHRLGQPATGTRLGGDQQFASCRQRATKPQCQFFQFVHASHLTPLP